MIQAYIFAILAMVYISSALVAHKTNDSSTTINPTASGPTRSGDQ
jgi:hypothetical protein